MLVVLSGDVLVELVIDQSTDQLVSLTMDQTADQAVDQLLDNLSMVSVVDLRVTQMVTQEVVLNVDFLDLDQRDSSMLAL